ncbi:MAG TPA: TonB family protein [Vicinamibacteria bacterium]|nr:TonB family protein [Vicinamibacteria bacterium]
MNSRPSNDPEGPEDPEEDELFAGSLVVSDPHFEKKRFGAALTVAIHFGLLFAVVLLPILWPEAMPDQTDYIRALLYNPPPPPPPPLPKGSSLVRKQEPAKPTTPDPTPKTPEFVQPETPREETKVQPEDKASEKDQFGSDTGSDAGVPEGMEGGVEGGVVGGVIGGTLGGCVGCTGDGPVLDYDQAPRPIKITRPVYPQEAFIKKVEGIVELEILIDATGRVVHARVTKSIPLLDQAAIQCVYLWQFSPAVKRGRPVATRANAPVTFRIF